ncbi:hypothetical protein PV04_05161 [Phialophora macrospora]|uniref:Uncharacterized protein n=1 Tax=Phialophora macrospora TaxID=1851006 RepID=A0A0D2GB36_9EURO|nr:hypothetical protein PV04_05161 [Phialophora macrospora]
MGNTQSQEGDSAELAPQHDTEDLEFDLSKIPDDRDAAERDTISHDETDRRHSDSPKTQKPARQQKRTIANHANRRNGKQKRRRSSNNTSNEAASDEPTRESQPAQESSDPIPEDRPLKETEPETYHIYAISDQSDAENVDNRTSGHVTNGFTAINGTSQHDTTEFQDESAGNSDSDSDQEDAAHALVQTPEPKSAVEALNLLASVAAIRPSAEGPPIEATTGIPEPRANADGRYLCPWVDIQGCTQTFAQKKGAVRHGKNQHTMTTRKIGVQAPTTTQTIPDTQPPSTPSTAAPQNAETPAIMVNNEGRYVCPWVDVHGCDLTFAHRRGAVRHARLHAKEFTCSVCKKVMTLQASLLKHMKEHTGQEIAAATNAGGETAEKQHTPGQQPHELSEVVGGEAEEPQQDVSTDISKEFATPQVTPRSDKEVQWISVKSMPRGAKGVVDAVLQDTEVDPVLHDTKFTDNIVHEVSNRQSSAASSVFDEEEIGVKETPVLTGKLKRKRSVEDTLEVTQMSPARRRKRKKASGSTPPTSIPSTEVANLETPKSSAIKAAARSRQLTDKIIPRLQTRQSSMDGWAQKFTPGSSLKHPTLNPTPPRQSSQRVQVLVPRTSQAGPSGTKQTRMQAPPSGEAMDVDDEEAEVGSSTKFRRKEPRKATYATRTGKKRAEPDVDYSTPSKEPAVKEREQFEAGVSDTDGTSPVDIATSVAKRTFPRQEGAPIEDDDQDSDFDVTQAPESENEVTQTDRPAKKARKSTGTQNPTRPDPANGVECVRCHRMFASQEQLRRHQKKRFAHIGLIKCLGCSEEFYATSALIRHEKDTGHGKGNGLQGRVGAFSQDEVNKLNKWRDTFCEYHNISRTEFNDMMTGTLERGKGAIWQWPFVKRAEFLKEYLNVLPYRNKRSLLRYRERNFQNVAGMKNWSAEDDHELIRLHKELGTKWAEIARRLGRTADAVSQRWRHKLQYGEVETGEWSKAEKVKFEKILQELCKDENGNELEDIQIPWNKVSEKMGSRSAQQCSNHYRALRSKKEHGRWVKVDASEKTPASTPVLKSKMELRLSGQERGRRGPRNILSEEFIREDDEADDESEPAEEDLEDEDAPDESAADAPECESEAEDEGEDDSSSASEDDTGPGRVARKPNPLPTKTPSKLLRSSQLFEQTQTNTSALKPPQTISRKRSSQPSQDRPSPNIPIQRRHISSRTPLKELHISENGEIDDEVTDESDDGDEDAEKRESSQDLTGAGADRNESDAESDEEVDEQNLPEDSTDDDGNEVVGTESDEETPDEGAEPSDDVQAVQYGSDVEEVAESESNTGDLTDDETEDDDEESADSDGDTQASDEKKTQSATSEDEAIPESEEEDDAQDDGPSEEADPPMSSFMASINESAKRANIKKVRSGSQTHGRTLMGLPVSGRHHRRAIWQRDSDEDSD